MVSRDLMMTCNHNIESAKAALKTSAVFGYHREKSAPTESVLEQQGVIRVRLEPQRFFVTDVGLDFTLVAVVLADLPKDVATISLKENPKAISWVEGHVNIIGHPDGKPLQISNRGKLLTNHNKPSNPFLYYSTDTEPGSSGAPALNDLSALLGVHICGQSDEGASEGGSKKRSNKIKKVSARNNSTNTNVKNSATSIVFIRKHLLDLKLKLKPSELFLLNEALGIAHVKTENPEKKDEDADMKPAAA